MNDYIYGKNAVIETLTSKSDRVNKVFIQKGAGLDNRLRKIVDLCKEMSIVFNFVDFKKFKELFGQEVNLQSVVASVSPVQYKDFDEFLSEEKGGKFRKIVILDGITDPHNFGAIIRTLAAASYDAVIIQNHRSVSVNSTVEKISSGAVNKVPVIKVNSVTGTIQKLKDNDWWIIATDAKADNNYFDIDYKNMNFAIVLGSEGTGISKPVLKLSDFKVSLPTNFESLNVSCACAVIVYETVRQISYT